MLRFVLSFHLFAMMLWFGCLSNAAGNLATDSTVLLSVEATQYEISSNENPLQLENTYPQESQKDCGNQDVCHYHGHCHCMGLHYVSYLLPILSWQKVGYGLEHVYPKSSISSIFRPPIV